MERQRTNERAWVADSENQRFLQIKRRKWRERNPDYLEKWRDEHPKAVQRNREFMQEYQRRKRQGPMFEKTKSLTLQVVKNKGVVYVSRGKTWLLMRLKRPLPWPEATGAVYTAKDIAKRKIRRPQGMLYDLSRRWG
jgi:hypothetical protein